MLEARVEHLPQTAETEGSRRLTGVPAVETIPPDVEVVAHKTRKRLTVGYKIRVIETVAELKANGSSSIIAS